METVVGQEYGSPASAASIRTPVRSLPPVPGGAEFGDLGAISQLADADGDQVVSVLRQFTLFGIKDLTGGWRETRGVAQAHWRNWGIGLNSKPLFGN